MDRRLLDGLIFLLLCVTVLLLLRHGVFGQGAGATATAKPAPTSGPKVNKILTHLRKRHRSTTAIPERKTTISTVSLWIVSRPSNCKVFADEQPQGETDANGELELKLEPGTHRIRVSREGYVTSESEVELTPTREPQEVEFTLAPPALATLNVVTDPPGAEVYLDDTYRGTSNSDGLLVIDRITPSQPHKLRVNKKPGHLEQSMPVTTLNGQISFKLLADSIRVKVTTDPPETEIYFDDVYKGVSTADGLLAIDQVNPNQSHRLRGKKLGFTDQIRLLSPNTSEVSIKLQPDPVILLVKDIRQQIADSHLVKAFDEYSQLTIDAPDNSEIARLLESILQSIQLRSADTLKRIEPFGLAINLNDAEEMKSLYDQARKWRAGDETIETLGKYWDMKLAFVRADQTTSALEKESLRRNAQPILKDLSDRNLRNIYLLMEVGWAWMKLNDTTAAQKHFTAAQELKPDWAYPPFANGVLALDAGDRETVKKLKLPKYQQAIDSFTKAIGLKHDFPRAYALRAIAYAYLKKPEESTASGLQAVTLDPKSAYAHFALGYAYFQKGKSGYRSARDEFNQALSLDGVELAEGTKNSIQQWLAIIQRSIK